MFKKLVTSIFLVALVTFVFAPKTYAVDTGSTSSGSGVCSLANIQGCTSSTSFGDSTLCDSVVSCANLIVNVLFLVAIFATTVFLILGGFKYITSQGDATKAKQGQEQITNAIIGLVIVVSAWALTWVTLKFATSDDPGVTEEQVIPGRLTE